MPVLERLSWVQRQIAAGRRCHISIGAARDQGKTKVKLTLQPPGEAANMYANMNVNALSSAIDFIQQLVANRVAVDRGHTHSDGVSVVEVWVSEPSAPVQPAAEAADGVHTAPAPPNLDAGSVLAQPFASDDHIEFPRREVSSSVDVDGAAPAAPEQPGDLPVRPDPMAATSALPDHDADTEVVRPCALVQLAAVVADGVHTASEPPNLDAGSVVARPLVSNDSIGSPRRDESSSVDVDSVAPAGHVQPGDLPARPYPKAATSARGRGKGSAPLPAPPDPRRERAAGIHAMSLPSLDTRCPVAAPLQGLRGSGMGIW